MSARVNTCYRDRWLPGLTIRWFELSPARGCATCGMGAGGYFRTGNAGDKFVEMDRYMAWRLKRLLIKKRGRNLHAGQAGRWTRAWFHDQGLQQLMGTIRYPKAA